MNQLTDRTPSTIVAPQGDQAPALPLFVQSVAIGDCLALARGIHAIRNGQRVSHTPGGAGVVSATNRMQGSRPEPSRPPRDMVCILRRYAMVVAPSSGEKKALIKEDS